MDEAVVELWADIGSESYWSDLLARSPAEYVSFAERWPQPGYIGSRYGTGTRVVVMGQNPRASNTARASESDREMFRLIREHASTRTPDSLRALFLMMRSFMLGEPPYKPAWRPITAATRTIGLDIDAIAYLNLIPLATHGDAVGPFFNAAFVRSTRKQLELLNPAKIVVYGQWAYDAFQSLSGRRYDVRHIQQRDYSMAPAVIDWLAE